MSAQIRDLQGQLQLSLTLPDTPQGPSEKDRNSESSQGETDMRKTKRKHLSSKCQKSKTHVRETGEHHQPPGEEDE